MANDVNLYNVNDGLTGRDGGPYLDQEEQRIAEERRAIVEGREPDYDNLPATAGTVLVPGSTVVRNAASINVPSQNNDAVLNEVAAAFVDSDSVSATAASTIPLDALNDDTEQKKVAEQTPEESAAQPDIGKPVSAESTDSKDSKSSSSSSSSTTASKTASSSSSSKS